MAARISPSLKDEAPLTMKRSDGLFAPLCRTLQVTGFYVPKSCSGVTRYFRMLYPVFILLILLGNIVRFGFTFVGESNISASLMIKLFLATFFVGNFFQTLLMMKTLGDNFEQFQEQVNAYTSRYGKDIKTARIVKAASIFVFVASFILELCFMVPVTFEGDAIDMYYFPFHRFRGVNYALGLTGLFFIGIVFLFSFYSLVVFFFTSYYFLARSYNDVNTTISKMVRSEFDPVMFERQRKRHASLCDLVSLADSFQAHTVTWTFGVVIPSDCFVLYGIINGQLNQSEYIFLICLLTSANALLVLVVYSASDLTEKAHGCHDDLFSVDISAIPQEAVNSVFLFHKRVSSTDIGFTLYRTFTVNRSTFLTILGTLMTYAVVVMQFQTNDISATENIANATCSP